MGPGFDGAVQHRFHTASGDRPTTFSRDAEWMLTSSSRAGVRQLFLSRTPPEQGESWPVAVADASRAWFRDDLSAIVYLVLDSSPASARVFRVSLSVDPEVELGAPELVHQFDGRATPYDFDGEGRLLVVTTDDESIPRVYLDTEGAERE